MTTGLTFHEKTHRYRLDGRPVPSVTTLIKDGLPSPALMYWAAKSVAEWVAENPGITDKMLELGGPGPLTAFLKNIPWQKRDTAGVRGTDVHHIAERLAAGEAVEYPDHYAGYVKACVTFLDDWGVEPLVMERPLAHRGHWWAGKPDLFARVRDGRTVLFDYKTSRGIYAETAFQLAAYSHAEFYVDEAGDEQPIPDVDLCAAVHLREDGYDVIPVKADAQTYAEFRHIAFVAETAKRAKGDRGTDGYVGQPLTPPSSGGPE